MTKLSTPIPTLRYSFLEFLKEQQITKFSTRNVMEWYEFRMFKLGKKFNSKAAYSALHRQVVNLLINEKCIKRTSRGIYETLSYEAPIIKEPQTTIDEIAEEKWAKLSGKDFNPDKLLDKPTLKTIIK